jgi:prepilin-type processing-associated H-X9-DG protein
VRDGASFWLLEEKGEFAMPRIGIEAEPHNWEDRRYAANFAFADGRILHATGRGPMAPPIDSLGRASILAGGPLTSSASSRSGDGGFVSTAKQSIPT